MTAPRHIAITGASSGLGAALARGYAGAGVRMLLMGRDRGRLASVAEAVRRAGAQAVVAVADLRDGAAVTAALLDFDDAHPLDLLIANAGITTGTGASGLEDPEAARRVIDVNLCGTLTSVEAVLPRMAARGRGQIAVVSSLAALFPHPDQPVYSATKAGLRAYVTALAPVMAKRGVAMSVICPGFVTSAMSEGYDGVKWLEETPDHAAWRVRRGLARRARFITFPRRMAFLVRLYAILPRRARDRILAGFRARISGPP